MIQKILFALFILLASYTNGLGQSKTGDFDYKTANLGISMDSCFAKTLAYLQKQNYFIEAVDKSAGFIRAKSFIKNTKVLSSEVGNRRTITFILTPSENQTVVSLNMYNESFKRGGNVNTLVYYYEDKGIVDEPAVYRSFLEEFKKGMQ